jgi:hypothetical protein
MQTEEVNIQPHITPLTLLLWRDKFFHRVKKPFTERVKDFFDWILSIRVHIETDSILLSKYKTVRKPLKN